MNFLADAISSGAAGLSAILILVLFGIGLILAICWIAFPFIVISKFNELLKVERETLTILRKHSDAQNETNKALQYMVDSNARGREFAEHSHSDSDD